MNYKPDYDWHESVFDMAKEAGAIIGIDIDDIYYSGFWSQGDGASFTGSYSYAKGAAKRIRAEFPSTTELHEIADTLQSIQARHFYRLSASITRGRGSNYYSHSGTMSVDVDSDDIREALRLFADWIYHVLKQEYEYQSAWNLASAWQDLATDAAAEKAAARELIRDMRKARRDDVPASICSALRSTVRRHLDAMADALRERKSIDDNFAYWTDDRRQLSVAEFAAANL